MADNNKTQNEYWEAVDSLADLLEFPWRLPAGTKVVLELELLKEGEQCDHFAAIEYVNFEREQSLSGVFRVNRIETNLRCS